MRASCVFDCRVNYCTTGFRSVSVVYSFKPAHILHRHLGSLVHMRSDSLEKIYKLFRRHKRFNFRPISCISSSPATEITRLQQIQNSLALEIVKASKSCHITPVLRSLHWLKITERIENKLRSLTYKALTTTQPPYLHHLISVQPPRSTRSSSLVTLARPPTSSSLRITDRSLWSPYVIGQTVVFSCCGLFFFLLSSFFLWSPYVIGQTIIFSSCFMVALCNRADHIYFHAVVCSSFFFLFLA